MTEIFTEWIETMVNILLSPVPATFKQEAKKANGKFASVIAWVSLTAIAGRLINPYSDSGVQAFSLVGRAILDPMIFLFFVFCLHKIAQAFFSPGPSRHNQILYLATAIYVLFFILNAVVGFFSENFLIFSSAVWVLFLIVLAIALKSITHLGFWQASLVTIFASILALAGQFCIPLFF